ncbi:MAG TPA: M48 family metallopeptidase [Phycisphaerae bacterium]|nr:M48 family metallopeptidase [Phycisphaerae bacterium]
MNFFQHEERARRNTKKLVVLFALAIICIVAALYFVAVIVVTFATHAHMMRSKVVYDDIVFSWWDPNVLGWVIAATFVIIGSGSLYKIYSLGSGGAVVAETLGGRLVKPETTDADERKLLNVVEEMAIASGLPTPLVYVLDKEDGINAFAAGFTPNDAAVAVTAAAMRMLKRDELQGVIAHEFSHVLCGDMRLNIRLIGLIHGILIIAIIGMQMIRVAGQGSGRRSGRGAAAMFVVGAALAVIGYIGVFFGRLIKAAISRQREYLADASAVDFTRNPDGIAGALKKIGGYGFSSRIMTASGEEVSHMLFGDGRLRAFQSFGFLSTHPPLVERIKRIDPSFDGTFPKVEGTARPSSAAEKAAAATGFVPAEAPAKRTLDPREVIKQAGSFSPAHMAFGAALITSMPEPLRQAARESARAVCLIHALLLDTDQAKRERQLGLLKDKLKPTLIEETVRLFDARGALDPAARLPLIDLAIPALRQLDQGQCRAFLRQVEILAGADQETSVFEFALQALLSHELRPVIEGVRRRAVQYPSYSPLQGDCVTILSILARLGQRDADGVLMAFRVGTARLPPDRRGVLEEPRPPEACSFSALAASLDRLALAAPIIKERVLDAFAHCVLADGTVTIEEAELLRTIARCMGCPLPPFLPSAGEGASGPTAPN